MKWYTIAFSVLSLAVSCFAAPLSVVIFVSDDQGYGDWSGAAHPSIDTPHIDALARGGTVFSSWLSANAVCTPSRAGILGGRLAVRSGMTSTTLQVFFSPAQPGGLPVGELTLADLLRAQGYATAAVGKWHLGINNSSGDMGSGFNDGAHLPTSHGFDNYYGLPTTNQPECRLNATDPLRCFLMRGTVVVEQPIVLPTLPERLDAEAVSFIHASVAAGRPFFLYYASPQPHTPLYASARHRGKSRRGAYGDAMLDVDASVGAIMQALTESGVADSTVVFYTSDNGAWLEEGIDGGSNGPLRGGKSQNYDGGIRVPGIVWGPGVRAGGSVRTPVSSLDIVPTVLDLAGLPSASGLDGVSIAHLLQEGDPEEGAEGRYFFHYCGYVLHAVRWGVWKAHWFTPRTTDSDAPRTSCKYFQGWEVNGCMCSPMASVAHTPPLLYHMDRDPGELFPVESDDPDYGAVLARLVAAHAAHLASTPHAPSQVFTVPQPGLQPCCNPPTCRCFE